MGSLEWLTSPWINVVGLFGGVSGLVSAGWTLWLYRKSEREKALARLSIITTQAKDALQVNLAFTPKDRAEQITAVIKSLTPDVDVIYNAGVTTISDGQGGFIPVGPSDVRRDRKLHVPLHYGRSSTAASTFFLARASPDGSSGKIESGKVMICVMRSVSRKVLVKTTRTISATL
ncbi:MULTISPECIES: hypothetical protein [unclassified Brevundimonas]|uniref:hypothetical protein n=1 Tax=unclassified Brevundimonas TaxID=2622653 RepID=UPI0025B8CBCA|nr:MULTISPECIES: hypothetical protein [unclassified Brevundimonas]